MPQQPRRDRLRRGFDEKHALPRDEDIVEPHDPVELVEAVGQRRGEPVAAARRDPAADRRHPERRDRHDKARVVLADLHAVQRADIDVLGIGRARVHADLAAEHDPGIGFAHDAQRRPRCRVVAQAKADRRGPAAECQEAPGIGDQPAIGFGVGDLLFRDVALLHGGQNAHRDQMPVGRVVRDVAGAVEQRLRRRTGPSRSGRRCCAAP